MIVEFAGCTGAGKTTLATRFASRLSEHGVEIQDRTSPGSSPFVTASNAASTPLHLCTIARNWSELAPVLALGERHISTRASSPAWRMLRFAGLIRRIGRHLRDSARGTDEICVVDEGVCGALELILGGTEQATPDVVDEVVSSMPLPDLIVWVDAPYESIVNRTRRRVDSPRELRALGEASLRKRLANSQANFRHMMARPAVSKRVVKAWNPDQPHYEMSRAVDRLVDDLIENNALHV
jgi:thymidylate kinase